MKKVILFAVAVLFVSFSYSQTATTVQDGSQLDPTTWDCSCIPYPSYSLVIDHTLTMDTGWVVMSGTSVQINSSGAMLDDGNGRGLSIDGGSLTNDGVLHMTNISVASGSITNNDSLAFSNMYVTADLVNNSNGEITGTDFTNEGNADNSGMIQVDNINNTGSFQNSGMIDPVDITNGTGGDFMIDMSGTLQADNFLNRGFMQNSGTLNSNNFAQTDSIGINIGTMDVSNNFLNEEEFVVDPNGQLYIGNDFYNGDSTAPSAWNATFLNHGYAHTEADWANVDSMLGDGQWCVGGYSYNSGEMDGTYDYCDTSSSTGTVDFNDGGFISGNISNCQGSITCFAPVTVQEQQKDETHLTVYPNPAADRLTLEVDGKGIERLELYDVYGKKIRTIQSNLEYRMDLDITDLARGIYYLRVKVEGGGHLGREVVVE